MHAVIKLPLLLKTEVAFSLKRVSSLLMMLFATSVSSPLSLFVLEFRFSRGS